MAEKKIVRTKWKREKDMGMLISLLTEKEEAELSTLDKGSLLYQLEAEEIDLKKPEANT